MAVLNHCAALSSVAFVFCIIDCGGLIFVGVVLNGIFFAGANLSGVVRVGVVTVALWFRLVKNQDVSIGPLARPFARALRCAHSFARSLTSLTPSLVGQ